MVNKYIISSDDDKPLRISTDLNGDALDRNVKIRRYSKILDNGEWQITEYDDNSLKESASTIVLSWDKISVFCKKSKFDVSGLFRKKSVFKTSKTQASIISLEPPSETDSLSSLSTLEKKRKDPNQLLDNVNGIVHGGESLAILGSSGAGKTTLLNVLNSRISKKCDVFGNVRINGKRVTANQLGNQIGYIQQDDIFIGTLTVYEHLRFLAMLKMSKEFTKAERLKRVDEVLKELNLMKCKNTKIGYVDKSGISGGEKRRLSFASEVLVDPIILFCDEPTSGLDSHMAQMIVNTISELKKKGKIIVSTIHQPSSQVFQQFDLICLLAHGRVAYFGKRENAYDFFSRLNYVCPFQYNPADFYIEVLSSKTGCDRIKHTNAICDAFKYSEYNKAILKEIETVAASVKENQNDVNEQEPIKRYNASYLKQFIWLLWRQFTSTLREPFATRVLFMQSIILGFFIGFIYFQEDNNQLGIQNRNGLIFIMLMLAVLPYVFGSISQFFNQASITRRDVKNRIYSIITYYAAKIIAELPQNILFPTITFTITYWLANLHPDWVVYVKIIGILALCANASVAFGTILAMLAPDIDSTIGLMGPTVLPMLIFSGFLVNNNSMPVYFRWIKYISWIYYSFEAIEIAVWSNTKSIECDIDIPMNATNSSVMFQHCIKDGDAVLNLFSMKKDNFDRDIYVLTAMATSLYIIGGIFMYIRSKLI